MKKDLIAIDAVRTEGGTQPRASINTTTVNEYAEAMRAGSIFPPVTVYHDGKDYWLADGFHRFHAARKNNATQIRAEVHQGTQRDAVLHSVGANAEHGLRRSPDDIKEAVETLLKDSEWGGKSDRWIAEKCRVHHATVSRHRAKSGVACDTSTARTGKDGKSYPSSKPPAEPVAGHEPPESEPQAPLSSTEAPQQPDPDSLEAVQADLDDLKADAKALAAKARKVGGVKGQDITRPWMGGYSHSGLVGTLNQYVRLLDDGRPVGGTPKKPVTARHQKAQEAAAK